jgi:hypothetical protein
MRKTGDQLSVLGFGCMRLPQKGARIDEDRARRQLLLAIESGVNYFDTAMPYHMGGSEPFLGRTLMGELRGRVKLATKMPHWNVHSREDMDRFLAVQLDNLSTDHIDYYLVHNLQAAAWEKLRGLGFEDFVRRAKNKGKIRNIGFSFHGGRPDFRAIVDDFPWEFCQIQLNFLDKDNQAGVEGMKYAASRGLGVIVMEPLRGGVLARRNIPKVQSLWDGAEIRRSPAEWALRWVWNHPEVTLALSGMNDEAQIEENLRTAEDALPGSLSEAEIRLIDQAGDTWRASLKVPCTGCRYCMPCASGVSIPDCFESYNSKYIGSTHGVNNPRIMYLVGLGGLFTGNPPGFASQCTQCGRCVKSCPQQLQIPDILKQVARELESPGMPIMRALINGFLRLDERRMRRKASRV